MSDFGSIVKKIRNSKKLSLKEVGKRGGLSHAYISQIENGKRLNPTHQVIEKLSQGLEVPYIELLEAAGYLGRLGRMQTNKDGQKYMLGKLEDVINMLANNNVFYEFIADDLKTLEKKYNDVLDIEEHITPEWLKRHALSAEYDSEWFYDLTTDLQNIAKKYNLDLELKTFLSKEEITYKGHIITDKEKQLITAYLDGLFSSR